MTDIPCIWNQFFPFFIRNDCIPVAGYFCNPNNHEEQNEEGNWNKPFIYLFIGHCHIKVSFTGQASTHDIQAEQLSEFTFSTL